MSDLHDAIKQDNLREAARLLRRGLLRPPVDVNIRDDSGATPLHYATGPATEFLLDRGADVGARDDRGATPLHYALVPETEFLLGRGADPNARDHQGRTPLHHGVIDCHYVAAPDTVTLLLAKGADVNAVDNGGETALHHAAMTTMGGLVRKENGRELARLLIENGADLNARNRAGLTPLHCAIWGKETATLLIDSGAELSLYTCAAIADEHALQMLDELLARGVSPNDVDSRGWTPLHWAAFGESHHRTKAVEMLLQHGAEVNARTPEGMTALEILYYNSPDGRAEVERVLVSQGAGADINPWLLPDPTHAVDVLFDRVLHVWPEYTDDMFHRRDIRPHNMSLLLGSCDEVRHVLCRYARLVLEHSLAELFAVRYYGFWGCCALEAVERHGDAFWTCISVKVMRTEGGRAVAAWSGHLWESVVKGYAADQTDSEL